MSSNLPQESTQADDRDLLRTELEKAGFQSLTNALDAVRIASTSKENYVDSRLPEPERFAPYLLKRAALGVPGLETIEHGIGRHGTAEYDQGKQLIYRDSKGQPIAIATLIPKGDGLAIHDLARDPTHPEAIKGTATIIRTLIRMGIVANEGSLSPDGADVQWHMATRMVARLHEDTRKKLEQMLRTEYRELRQA